MLKILGSWLGFRACGLRLGHQGLGLMVRGLGFAGFSISGLWRGRV